MRHGQQRDPNAWQRVERSIQRDRDKADEPFPFHRRPRLLPGQKADQRLAAEYTHTVSRHHRSIELPQTRVVPSVGVRQKNRPWRVEPRATPVT
jgi:hypothetical protein